MDKESVPYSILKLFTIVNTLLLENSVVYQAPTVKKAFQILELVEQGVELGLVYAKVLFGHDRPTDFFELPFDGIAKAAAPVGVLAVDGDRLLRGCPEALGDSILQRLHVGDTQFLGRGPSLEHPVAVLVGVGRKGLIDHLGRAKAEKVRDMVLGRHFHGRYRH